MYICLIPQAKNHGETGPCIVLLEHEGTCYEFEELPSTVDKLTLSYAMGMDNWAFLHDYWPQRYLRDRNDTYCIDKYNLYKMNSGNPGVFNDTRKPFIIDIVFGWTEEMFLDSVIWDSVIEGLPLNTFTHITVSTQTETTGRRALADPRKIKGLFSFNEIRSMVKQLPFKDNVFNDYNILQNSVADYLPWYEKKRMIDNHAIVRLEYDATNVITFIGATADSKNSSR
jgi:hypothetical protein